MSITQSLNNLPPKTRRIVLSITAFALVIGVSFFVTNLTERKASRVPRANKPEVTVVSPQRATGLEQYGARFDRRAPSRARPAAPPAPARRAPA